MSKKTTAIFIKTWVNDFPWLKYCLASIEKFASGYDEIIVAVETQDINQFENQFGNWMHMIKVIPVINPGIDGYMFQQICKLNAWLHTKCDYIQFMDSDCMFTRPVTPDDFIENGKPIILMTKYSSLGGSIPWQKPTETYMGSSVLYEYMRTNGLMYHKDTLVQISVYHPNLIWEIKQIRDRSFSEFNFIGAFAHKHVANKYAFKDTETDVWEPFPILQKWSWGGLTPEIRDELNLILQL